MTEREESFRLPFEEELRSRTNDANEIYSYIHGNIITNIDNNIFFNARVMPNHIFRLILMNQQDTNGNNTALYRQMRSLFQSDTDYYINNGNANGIAALQIYSLPSVAIL